MKNCNSKNDRNIFGLVIVLGGFALAAGCGDAGASDDKVGAESPCEASCAHADACPNLYAETDCVSECELTRERAAALGGTCAYALEDFVECYSTLSCEDIGARKAASDEKPVEPVELGPISNRTVEAPRDDLVQLCPLVDRGERLESLNSRADVAASGDNAAQLNPRLGPEV